MLPLTHQTLQSRLFNYYSLFFCIVLFLIAAILFTALYNYNRNNIAEQQQQLSRSISHAIDQELEKMNHFSMNIVYSNLVKEHFNNDLTPISEEYEGGIIIDLERYESTTTLIDVILAIISSSQTAKQANIYDFDGKMLGAGLFNGELTIDVTNRTWYPETKAQDGFKHLSLVREEDLPYSIKQHSTNPTYVALTRVYKDRHYVEQGIVEILQGANTVFNTIHNTMNSNEQIDIYVVDEQGTFFYPYEQQLDSFYGDDYVDLIQQLSLIEDKTHHITSPSDQSKQLMIHTSSSQTGLSIILVQNQKELYAFLNRMTYLFVVIFIVALGVILWISFIVSKRVTHPLNQLTKKIKQMDLTNLANTNDLHTESFSIGEIDTLNRSFHAMNQKLSHSLDELLIARSQEMDAKFLALQSQMNPHFLYNNLSNISAMAEAGMDREIVKLCENMSFMLRYISTESKQGVPLRDELSYTKHYLECMDIRYEDQLSYTFDIPDEMSTIIVPKLSIQPLVENAIKHGLHVSPPWHMTISGQQTHTNWSITITDNGPGFDPDIINQLQAFLTENNLRALPKLSINGMGLKNVITRLKLMYQNELSLDIKNRQNGGAMITISISTQESKMEE
ncbi:cache domain-containing sensor histidine kinase [Halalkalibacter hemicellulosilyticus]|uniref:Signal transduction protein with a C-terminal ATPase domain n=1 Tax=Halalkalibacter hemicellulosilyticusJCM 9152 TaxID=1236971 RepID=W4QHJ9_9BACI|nr:sensor histidine kinase [Halalkalibacter hemicellulosilyticus]GAE31382.1 signal transduction protein with a C-terminal ATPase domain [Halalkalibacter hemicellulosilyticusJCM 9152]